jgi:hypothetical protein
VRGTAEEEAHALAAGAEKREVTGGATPHPAVARARLHRGDEAERLTDALGAHAVTVGSNVYLSPRAPDLDSAEGRRLLAHELVHVVQQDRFGARFQCFTAAERPQIAPSLSAMMGVVEAIVGAAATGDSVDMDDLVRNAGGRAAGAGLPPALRSDQPAIRSMLTYRYLFTSRAGLVDMRHFFQLMYISWFFEPLVYGASNRAATKKGIEHETTSEDASKFAPEDLTSNALGAWTATRLAGLPQKADVVARVRETLERCAPVDFAGLSGPSQDSVVDFYAAQDAAGQPVNQNRTAVALVPRVPELAGKDRSFPFELDHEDPDRATIRGTAFGGGAAGLTGDTEIREFVATQREEVLRDIVPGQLERLCTRLMQGWVADEDLDAFERLYRLADPATRDRIRLANPSEKLSGGQRWRLKILYGAVP